MHSPLTHYNIIMHIILNYVATYIMFSCAHVHIIGAYQHSEYCIIQNNNEDEAVHEPMTHNDDELVHSDNIDEDEVGSYNILLYINT